MVYHGDPIKKMGLSIFALKDYGISWGSAWGYHGSTANPMNIDPRELFLPGYTNPWIRLKGLMIVAESLVYPRIQHPGINHQIKGDT